MHEFDPGFDDLPASHTLQIDDPSLSEYVPEIHIEHPVVAPITSDAFPVGQSVHIVCCDIELYFPIGQ